ncbi:MAG: hypothetical protein DMG14_31060 [Acidobacteria bacterium]|nr:MAG: hypothetical protein DMG14_31060 [Acidobacteriota bacterium]
MEEQFEYRFEWDPIKADRNAKDHGVTFEQAATVFLDAKLLSQLDEEHGQEEERGSVSAWTSPLGFWLLHRDVSSAGAPGHGIGPLFQCVPSGPDAPARFNWACA